MNYKTYDFEETMSLSLENSFGILDQEDGVKIKITIGIDKDDGTGYFEFYDIESGGEVWHAEGGLWFNGNELTDYDGVFDLPTPIKTKLKELNYKVDF